MGGGWLVEIVVLAMIAGFVALRLVSVLGRRTGHEEPVGQPVDAPRAEPLDPQLSNSEFRARTAAIEEVAIDPPAVEGVRAIVAADSSFDLNQFLQGAQSAYRMTLEAFWSGDLEALSTLAVDEVAADFGEAITVREADKLRLDNRLVGIEAARVVAAELKGMMASISVRFDADIVAVTRDEAGAVVAGSTSDAVQTHDVWTFSRHVRADDPNWLLVATDEDQ